MEHSSGFVNKEQGRRLSGGDGGLLSLQQAQEKLEEIAT